MPSMMVIEGGTFGEAFESGAFMSRIIALVRKDMREMTSLPSAM